MTHAVPILTEKNEPWEQQDGESMTAFAAFQKYRDIPSAQRTITQLAREMDPSRPKRKYHQLLRYSSLFKWLARVAAWEKYKDSVGREVQLDQIREMNTQHIDLAQSIRQIVGHEIALRLKKIRDQVAAGEDAGISELSPGELVKMLEAAVKLERQAHGEPADIKCEDLAISARDKRHMLRSLVGDPAALRTLDQLIITHEKAGDSSPASEQPADDRPDSNTIH